MADADEYESLPAATPLNIVAAAGAVAGIAEHCAMFPVDSVKVRILTSSEIHGRVFCQLVGENYDNN